MLLPFDDLVLEPDPAIRRDELAPGKLPVLLHIEDRAARERHESSHLADVEHAAWSRLHLGHFQHLRAPFCAPLPRADSRPRLSAASVPNKIGSPQRASPGPRVISLHIRLLGRLRISMAAGSAS